MKTKVLLIILALSSSFMFGQSKVADKFFKEFAYVKAAELYEEALDKDREKDNRLHILLRLGDSYYNNSMTVEAADKYKEALESIEENNGEYPIEQTYRYIQTQRSLENFEEEKKWMEIFKTIVTNDRRIDSEVTDVTTYENLKDTSEKYLIVKNLDLNTEYSDFGGYEFGGKMYFASNRKTEDHKGNKVYKWNDQPFLDIYEASVTTDGLNNEYGSPLVINNEDVITNYHEASVAVTNDGKTIYFTRDNLRKSKRLDSDKKGTTHLKIYKATLDAENWADIEELSFNHDDFSTGHPALSPDGSKLYFVSDRKVEGAKGQTDIYYVDIIKEDGNTTYGDPVALDAVNTEGREMFPYIAKDSTLYFSSDGYQNLGLLDIFTSNVLRDGDSITNMGAPYNSDADDFAFFKDVDTKAGYFSSNREGGKGDDDIYSFLEYQCEQTLKGTLTDCETGDVLGDATVELVDSEGVIVETTTTAADGTYSFDKPLDCNSNYSIRGSKPDYEANVASFTTSKTHKDENVVDLCLVLLVKPCEEVVIDNIEFDFDKAIVRDSEKYKLENIVDVMRDNPDMMIVIESHTDNRGSDQYNEILSFCRAKSTRAYLIERGIEPARLPQFFGCGEYCKLVSDEDIAKLSSRKEKEDAHQKNRRSVFKIIDCKPKQGEENKIPSCEDCKEGTMEDDECVDCKECARFHN